MIAKMTVEKSPPFRMTAPRLTSSAGRCSHIDTDVTTLLYAAFCKTLIQLLYRVPVRVRNCMRRNPVFTKRASARKK